MRWIFFTVLLVSLSVEAQNKENNSLFISPNIGVALLGGQKIKDVRSLATSEYDSKITWIAGANFGYKFNSIAVDLGISYFSSELTMDARSNSCTIRNVCLFGERKNFLASLGGTIYFLGNKSQVMPYLTLRAGMSRSHAIFKEFGNLSPNSGQSASVRASAELVKIDHKSFVPFAQLGAGVDLSYGLGIGYRLMWLGSQRARTISGLQELELMSSFNHIAELRFTIPFQ